MHVICSLLLDPPMEGSITHCSSSVRLSGLLTQDLIIMSSCHYHVNYIHFVQLNIWKEKVRTTEGFHGMAVLTVRSNRPKANCYSSLEAERFLLLQK